MNNKPLKPLTRVGYERLVSEFNTLRDIERPKVVQGIATAAGEGDRSENAEYIYGKKRLREIDKRLRYLTGIIKDVTVIDPTKLSGDRVCFGSTVELLDDAGISRELMLVGVGEVQSNTSQISWQSPVGRALLGKFVGDTVDVVVPAGRVSYEIVGIKFIAQMNDQ